MTEPEVSLFVAMHHIQNRNVEEEIVVSLDGSHISMKGKLHFDVVGFLHENGYEKSDGKEGWQGRYQNTAYPAKINITSKSGEGDVLLTMKSGQRFFVESKKFKSGNSAELPAMREAIGQLMTGKCSPDEIPVVAVPYTDRSKRLAEEWLSMERVRMVGIRFWLVHSDGRVEEINRV